MSDSWRDLIDVHQAAELFPPMSEEDLKDLAKDIDEHGLAIPPLVFFSGKAKPMLVDGRNRLDALALLGSRFEITRSEHGAWVHCRYADEDVHWPIQKRRRGFDPYGLVASLNIQRRHLTTAQKRELVAKLVAAQPDKSNRAIAKMAKVSDKTVGTVRGKLEARAEIPHVSTRTDAKGRKQPSTKPKTEQTVERLFDPSSLSGEAAVPPDAPSEPSREPTTEEGLARVAELYGEPQDHVDSGGKVDWVTVKALDTLADDLGRMLKDMGKDRSIAMLPQAKRMDLARQFLALLSVSVDDLVAPVTMPIGEAEPVTKTPRSPMRRRN